MKEFKLNGLWSTYFQFRTPNSALRTQTGFTYMTLLAAIVVIGISLGAAGKYWSNISLRDKEDELLFRGDQYRNAIERYYAALPNKHQFPESIDDLLVDNRTAMGKRHLRKKYKDPITNEDFFELRDQLTRRIIGVRSTSDKKPLKRDNFEDIHKEFAGKDRYSDWQFILTIPQVPAGAPPPIRR